MTASQTRLQIRTFIRATRERVFAAWTDPNLVKEWIAPGALTVPDASIDLRIGGSFQIEMEGVMRGQQQHGTASGHYTKIIPNELLVFTWTWSGYAFPETLVTVEFKDVKDGTEITLTHDRFGDTEVRDRYNSGWHSTFEKLAKLIGT
ncbi:MAG: SRPBCC family protein [Acidiferrobacterales bacterium]